MHFENDAEYRKRLAMGFLEEARLNLKYELWRSCVDNSQLSIENAGKMIVALLEPVEKSHNPAHQLKRIVERAELDDFLKSRIIEIIPALERFGIEEHFMTDYGDETTRTDPWALFNEDDAIEALKMAEETFAKVENIYFDFLRSKEKDESES